jgi:hypothetical protein
VHISSTTAKPWEDAGTVFVRNVGIDCLVTRRYTAEGKGPRIAFDLHFVAEADIHIKVQRTVILLFHVSVKIGVSRRGRNIS